MIFLGLDQLSLNMDNRFLVLKDNTFISCYGGRSDMWRVVMI